MISLNEDQLKKRKGLLVERLAAELSNPERKPGMCPKWGNCSYIHDNIIALNMDVGAAYRYASIVCERYHQICELNLENENNGKTINTRLD